MSRTKLGCSVFVSRFVLFFVAIVFLSFSTTVSFAVDGEPVEGSVDEYLAAEIELYNLREEIEKSLEKYINENSVHALLGKEMSIDPSNMDHRQDVDEFLKVNKDKIVEVITNDMVNNKFAGFGATDQNQASSVMGPSSCSAVETTYITLCLPPYTCEHVYKPFGKTSRYGYVITIKWKVCEENGRKRLVIELIKKEAAGCCMKVEPSIRVKH